MTTNIANVHNNNNNTGKYPVFLGEDLGFSDAINVTYKKIEDNYFAQRSLFWTETEFSFESDRLDLLTAPESEKDIMVLNLLSQWLMDSVASRGVYTIFAPFISNNEVASWLQVQAFFEEIHARTYSKIIRNAFTDSNEVLEMGKAELNVFKRSKRIGEVFNELISLGNSYSKGEIGNTPEEIRHIKLVLMKGVLTLFALEQISFQSSFASTFALVETGKYSGIGKSVNAILTDELVHAKGDLDVFSALFSEPDYKEIFAENKQVFKSILDSIVQQEIEWSDFIFSNGRKVLGLNASILKEYVAYIAEPAYRVLEIEKTDFVINAPKQNPLSYMDKYINRDLIQTANQELENGNYKIGMVDNDLADNEVYDF